MCVAAAIAAVAQTEEPDSLSVSELGEVVVEGRLQRTGAEKSTYIPTTKQKNASQTGVDLLNQLAIPQLRISTGEEIEASDGKSVAIYIDYIPASAEDLKAMRMSDVKRVEYLKYPSDPRLQGNANVVNFIMEKYEYGGYVKGFGHANLISFSEQLLGSVRLQYKKMTYDLMGWGFNANSDHKGMAETETYRLPQPDGTTAEFSRNSNTTGSKWRNQQYFATFKATFNSDKIQAESQVSGKINNTPHEDRNGTVSYSDEIFPTSVYSSNSDTNSKFISYNGYYFFVLPKGNSLTFIPSFTFNHTEQSSVYAEEGFEPIQNSAKDNTSQLNASLKYKHDFGKYGCITSFVYGSYDNARTRYSGSVDAFDRAQSSMLNAGVAYNVTVGRLYGLVGFGWKWNWLKVNDVKDTPSLPWVDLSLQYGFNDSHSVSLDYHYSSWAPSPNFKSANVIQSTPLMSYTGNPALVPAKMNDIGLSYTGIPSNTVSYSVFAWGYSINDRYAYVYEASPEGVVRTIQQPMGLWWQLRYGANGTVKLFDRKLLLTGQVSHYLNHNGKPYNMDNSKPAWYAMATYYLNNWNFSLAYISAGEIADGWMNGYMMQTKDTWYIRVSWASGDWNIRANLVNLTRWNWRGEKMKMRSDVYDDYQQAINSSFHAFAQLQVTYTFGFGKKVERTNEPTVSGSTTSGILH